LLEAQKDYEKAIDEINKSTMKKLQDLKDKLAEVAALMKSLSAASAAAAVNNALHTHLLLLQLFLAEQVATGTQQQLITTHLLLVLI
jgi:hypothetical protein